jgi:CheY-like chemotaxis protein
MNEGSLVHIVYVEDNFPNQHLIERIAHTGQHAVTTYSTAEDALYNFSSDQPDLLLVDVSLAGPMNGLEFVRHLREQGHTLPIIAITAVAEQGDCLDAGCDAYFVKPIPVQDVHELIEQYAAR